MFLTKEDFETGGLCVSANVFSAEMFEDKSDRTLMMGYNQDRNNVHVYLMDEELCVITYTMDFMLISEERGEFDELFSVIPSKRVYPESTDKEFYEILVKNDVSPQFARYSVEREKYYENKVVHGKTYKDNLKVPRAMLCPG